MYANETNSYDLLVLRLKLTSSFPPIALAKADNSDITAGGNTTVTDWGVTFLKVATYRPYYFVSTCPWVISSGSFITEKSSDDVLIGVVNCNNECRY
ncbi:unnamed protein product [Peronospora farinosa]|uniref:Uncharacterized protein n=1 Tax=Peronospora farinosa TaxID=134698 RepID=A0AAV0UIN8_9STRA|nr:unnamed protein product [Peronospora farinosa]CAI5735385.1 unnamed protein product [Peronospora farinosa]